MSHHYLILFIEPFRWGVFHSTENITPGEVKMFLEQGAKDVVNITDPQEPMSLVFHRPHKPENN